MGKKIFIIGVLFISLMNPLSVLAGDLNDNELAIIEIAKGKFVVDGITYKVSEPYIKELINYLNSDDVDITDRQKEEAIDTLYNNLVRGVKEGYLVLDESVSGNTKPEEDLDNGTSNSNDTSNNNGTSQGEDTSNNEVGQSKDNQNSNSSTENDFIKDFIEEKEPSIVIDNDKGVVRVTDENQTDILTVNTVIKNTGFNLYITAIVAVGLGVIMLGCFIVAVKYRLFAWQDE